MKLKFIQSFKEIDRRFVFVLLAEIAFYAALVITAVISLKIAAAGVSAFSQIPVEMLDITQISDVSQFDTGLEQAASLLGTFKTHITLSILFFIAMFIISFTVFKGIAWAIVTKQKMGRKYFLQFFKAAACMIGGTAILLVIVFWATLPAATGFLTMLILSIASYIIPVSCAVFKLNKTIKEWLKQAWHVGIERIYHFILPTITSGIIILILILIIASAGLLMPATATSLLLLVSIIIWQAWLKYYIYLVARGIK
jgi:hypothetical protein